MYEKTCPTCNGEGKVWTSGFASRTKELRRGDTCHCDGPPHAFDPDWCKPHD